MKISQLTNKIFTVALLFCVTFSSAQDKNKEEKKPFWSADRIVIGGEVVPGFGTITSIYAAPTIGYKITDKFIAGLGPTYIYYNNHPYNFSFNVYGGEIFARYYPLDFLFAHAEYQPLNAAWDRIVYTGIGTLNKDRFWINNFWLGGGLRQTFGSAAAYIMCLINVNESIYDFPHSPWVRGGLTFSL
ncbi:MAG TPA: hypothetical protein VI112_15990 [Bacteroidia bacterium]